MKLISKEKFEELRDKINTKKQEVQSKSKGIILFDFHFPPFGTEEKITERFNQIMKELEKYLLKH